MTMIIIATIACACVFFIVLVLKSDVLVIHEYEQERRWADQVTRKKKKRNGEQMATLGELFHQAELFHPMDTHRVTVAPPPIPQTKPTHETIKR